MRGAASSRGSAFFFQAFTFLLGYDWNVAHTPVRFSAAVLFILTGIARLHAAEVPRKTPAGDPSAAAQQGTKLAENGRCADALPLLVKSVSRVTDKDLKRTAAFRGVRCAMALNHMDAALDFIRTLNRDFPSDPEILYLSTHVFSDLSIRASQELLFKHPSSYQVHQLNAEALETQGRWQEAAAEYRNVLAQNPRLPGIHYRLGQLILSQPKTPTTAEDARREFEQELKINPSNAGAEYVLGELARQADQWPQAIEHFSRASKLDSGFGDAFIGLDGRSSLAGAHPKPSRRSKQPRSCSRAIRCAITTWRSRTAAPAARLTLTGKSPCTSRPRKRSARLPRKFNSACSDRSAWIRANPTNRTALRARSNPAIKAVAIALQQIPLAALPFAADLRPGAGSNILNAGPPAQEPADPVQFSNVTNSLLARAKKGILTMLEEAVNGGCLYAGVSRTATLCIATKGDGTFADVTARAVCPASAWTGMPWADYDNDGFPIFTSPVRQEHHVSQYQTP